MSRLKRSTTDQDYGLLVAARIAHVEPPRRPSSEEVERYWTEQAARHGAAPAASWSDHRAIELEVRTILPFVTGLPSLLDVGCGNGLSTAQYAPAVRGDVIGVDYISRLIELAEERRQELPEDVRQRLAFKVGDIRALDIPDDSFAGAVITRVLINLSSETEQAQALSEVARVVWPSGVVLLSEATVDGWSRLNALRVEWGLPPLPMPWFNKYIDERSLDFQAAGFALERVVDFSSSYYLITRVLKPLFARLMGEIVDPADPDSELNRLACQLPSVGDYGTQKLFVLRRISS